MYIALKDGRAVPPTPLAHLESKTTCPECGEPVIAKCGPQMVHHWAHAVNSNCPSARGETQWHLHWKTLVEPHECEVTLAAWPNNRADICLDLGFGDSYCVVEAQHSPIDFMDIIARYHAYEELVWVVDGSTHFSLFGEGHNIKASLGGKWKQFLKAQRYLAKPELMPIFFDYEGYWYLLLYGRWTTRESIQRMPVSGQKNYVLIENESENHRRLWRFNRPINRRELIANIIGARNTLKTEYEMINNHRARLKPLEALRRLRDEIMRGKDPMEGARPEIKITQAEQRYPV